MQKRVLVCPLDWGLGHATRCIPVIRELQKRDCEVIVATSGHALSLLKLEFPKNIFYETASYNIRYPANGSLAISILRQLPEIMVAVRKEGEQVKEIVEKEKIDFLISDNRYGCWSATVKNVFITHQVSPAIPCVIRWMKPMFDLWHKRQIQKFQECWVPDFEDRRFTGSLSDSGKLPLRFVGLLSRMKKTPGTLPFKYDLLALVSGPEPQRTVLEEMLLTALVKTSYQFCLVRGLPGAEHATTGNTVNHLKADDLCRRIEESEIVICRSGYSTLMDLSVLEKKAIFIPTPGQTEQEYLAKRMESKGIAFFQNQGEFDLKVAMEKVKHYSGFAGTYSASDLLPQAIDQLLEKLND